MLNYYFDFTVYDVDGGRDLDIFDINEGILGKKQKKKTPEENVLFFFQIPNSVLLNFLCALIWSEAGLNLAEGDIVLDEVT